MKRLTVITGHFAQERTQALGKELCSKGLINKAKAVTVLVTGAAGNIGYAIAFMIAQGAMLGHDQPINLHLLDLQPFEKAVEGLAMELRDCAFPILKKIVVTTDIQKAFSGVDVAILIGAKPRGPGMERKDLLQANAKIFEEQGKALDQFANKNVRVLVVGNPANTNALITQTHAKSIPRENITAMMRLDQSRAVSQVAAKAGLDNNQVKNVIVWGNHSATQYPDVNHAVIRDYPCGGFATSARAVVNDNKWVDKDFIETVQKRGAAIIAARGKSSAASAACAAVDHVRSWILGTAPGEWVSMGVISDGSYGVPEGIVYSFPCTTQGGHYKIVHGLKLDENSQKLMKITADELLGERKDALGY